MLKMSTRIEPTTTRMPEDEVRDRKEGMVHGCEGKGGRKVRGRERGKEKRRGRKEGG